MPILESSAIEGIGRAGQSDSRKVPILESSAMEGIHCTGHRTVRASGQPDRTAFRMDGAAGIDEGSRCSHWDS